MNWGHKLTAVIILFLVGMLSMVYVAVKQNVQTIDANYYSEEVKYQSKIDAKDNFQTLDTTGFLRNTEQELCIDIPNGSEQEQFQKGQCKLYYMANGALDQTFPLTLEAQCFPKAKLQKGLYILKVEWSTSLRSYFFERKLTL